MSIHIPQLIYKIIENACCNTNESNARIISAQGITYILHLDTNHVYNLVKKHVGNFDPLRKRIELFEDYDEDDHEELLMQDAFKVIVPILLRIGKI